MRIDPKVIKKVKVLWETKTSKEYPTVKIAEDFGVSRNSIILWARRYSWEARPVDKKKLGAPEKFKPEYCSMAKALCMLGHTNAQLAAFFNVTPQSVYNWLKQFPEFFEAVRGGRENADIKVALSLFQRACGYELEEEKVFFDKDAEGEKRFARGKVRKHYPPDVKAAITWLKAKHPEVWEETVNNNVEHSGMVETKFTVEFIDGD